MGGIIHNVADAVVLIIGFSITIFVHELSHFITALRLGLVVETFSIGFGPAMWQRERKGITYKIGWIPFGGYVALPQLDPAGMQTVQGKQDAGDAKETEDDKSVPSDEGAAEQRPLPYISPWKKIIVAASGVIGNVILAIVLAWVVSLGPATETTSQDTEIGYVDPDSASYEAGLRPGDEIVSVGGEKVSTWHDVNVLSVLHGGPEAGVDMVVRRNEQRRSLSVPVTEGEMGEYMVRGLSPSAPCVIGAVMEGGSAEDAGLQAGDVVLAFRDTPVASLDHFISLVADAEAEPSEIVARRDGEELTLSVTPRYNEELGRALIGVELSVGTVGVLPWMRYRNPWRQLRGDASEIVRILKALMTPKQSKQAAGALGGPVMIITWLWVSIKISMFNAIGFLRFLNVNLAIINMLPFPVLDGGHIVFCLWEGVTRRRAHPKVVNVLVNAFAILLIGVFILLTTRDFMRVPKMIGGLRALLGADEPEQVETNAPTAGPTNAP